MGIKFTYSLYYTVIQSVILLHQISVCLNHPPITQGCWSYRKLLGNISTLSKIINQYPKVKLVLYGYTHHHSMNK